MEGRDGSSWLKEDPDAALDRHFAAHPEDQDANVVIYNFFDEGLTRHGLISDPVEFQK